jgi:hypothetical protein
VQVSRSLDAIEQHANAGVAVANFGDGSSLAGQSWAVRGSEFIHFKTSADNQSVDFVSILPPV